MPRFKVKSPLDHNGELYAVGDIVEMSEKQAAAIPHAVEAAPEPKKPEQAPKSSK